METDYKKDFIVTWSKPGDAAYTQEGYMGEDLEEYHGETSVERIRQMFKEYNHGRGPVFQRTILRVEEVQHRTIFELKPE